MSIDAPPPLFPNESLSIIVIGASGDLALKKIFPALFSLYSQNLLPDDFRVLGFSRTTMDHEAFRNKLTENLTCRYVPNETSCAEKMDKFLTHCWYVSGDYASTDSFLEIYQTLQIQGESRDSNRIFYMSIPPFLFLDVARSIGAAGLVNCGGKQGGWVRVVIEKPFGRDRESSDALAEQMAKVFTEGQTYRIDHYLGKEVIQNLMVLRFANRIFEPIWNHSHIQSVEISFREKIGVEGRGGYFDPYGIIRDVVQNHLLQILALVAMERPKRLDAQSVRNEKVKVLRAIAPATLKNMTLGQYARSAQGAPPHPSYTEDPTVPDDSLAQTFVTAALRVDNERWRDVPFTLLAGKGLNDHATEIRIVFRPVDNTIFQSSADTLASNELLIRVQPDESIVFKIVNKTPGLEMNLTDGKLNMRYKSAFKQVMPEAYESLLLDVVRGDKSLFIRKDELAAAWDIFTPALHEIDENRIAPKPYPFGSSRL